MTENVNFKSGLNKIQPLNGCVIFLHSDFHYDCDINRKGDEGIEWAVYNTMLKVSFLSVLPQSRGKINDTRADSHTSGKFTGDFRVKMDN